MADNIKVQFLCSDADKFHEELRALIAKYESDGGGLDVTVETHIYS